MIRFANRLVALCGLLFLVTGCAVQREVTITARPADAVISVGGVQRGPGPVTAVLTFNTAQDVVRVGASRLGYKDKVLEITQQNVRDTINIELPPQTKRVTITSSPVPAVLSVDGKPLVADPVRSVTRDLEFTVDARNQWNTYVVTAERPGYEKAQRVVSFTDGVGEYVLNLEQKKKDLNITTTPPGAEVTIDGRAVGTSPVQVSALPFDVDDQGQWVAKRVRAVKPGYDPVDVPISWDDGRADYNVALLPKAKLVRITPDPAGSVVTIDGKELERDANGVSSVKLPFPPIDEKGTLRAYTATVSKKTETSEWYPLEQVIGWDDGREDYFVTLKEVLTRPVPTISLAMKRTDEGWRATADEKPTLGTKSVSEGAGVEPPQRLMALPRGQTIQSLAVSPDGKSIVFSVLTNERGDLRAQLRKINTDGGAGVTELTDGQTLDVMPTFTPDGQSILFASNRMVRRGSGQLGICSVAADGKGGIRQRTTPNFSSHGNPTMDSDAQPRLFYEVYLDGNPEPRIYMTPADRVLQTDIAAGTYPRVSPTNDSVAYLAAAPRTGKRDIYRMNDKFTQSESLTSTPDADEGDIAWSPDGRRIAFTSDRAVDAENRNNADIWILDTSDPSQPVQVTTNGSVDDCPQWSPTGDAIYFRSNRGGEWGIWRIRVPGAPATRR
jgi:Tol biopolymer transport system component